MKFLIRESSYAPEFQKARVPTIDTLSSQPGDCSRWRRLVELKSGFPSGSRFFRRKWPLETLLSLRRRPLGRMNGRENEIRDRSEKRPSVSVRYAGNRVADF